MELIGMLDSPYVRRTAISLRLLGLPFVHRSISVFGGYAAFAVINPVVKAPTLVCDDATVLMDSTLIIDYAEMLAGRRLMPSGNRERTRALRIVGLGLAACEKAVQIVYEQKLRPAEKQHAPWMQRVTGQLVAALAELEAELARQPLASDAAGVTQVGVTQAGVTVAVTWGFVQLMLSETIDPATYPCLAGYAALMERLPAFLELPAV